MKVGKSYKTNYVMDYLLSDTFNVVRADGTYRPGETFLVVEYAPKSDDGRVHWYKILAPNVFGWLSVVIDEDAILDEHGFSFIHGLGIDSYICELTYEGLMPT